MKVRKKIKRLRVFSRRLGRGLHVEWKETVEIPALLQKREYKKAGAQVADLFKMAGLTVIWVIPGGAVLTAMILKVSHKARPSAFHPKARSAVEKIDEENFFKGSEV